MNRDVVWTPVSWPGFEHLRVRTDGARIVADGLIIAALDGNPVRLGYEVVCDDGWRTQQFSLEPNGAPRTTLVRGEGDRWYRDGVAVPGLAGCTDVDISLTPYTNTLPIRRLQLAPGQSADLRAVYVLLEPTLEITTSDQTYTRLPVDDEAQYRYQSGDFVADLQVDADGIVTDYPGLWVGRALVVPENSSTSDHAH